MASQTAQPPPFSLFTRGLTSRARDTKKKSWNDEDWYIPYNGPYEAPREAPRRQKARDSWGDLVDDYGDDGGGEDDILLADRELHLRYGGGVDNGHGQGGDGGRLSSGLGDEDRKGRNRDRTLSAISRRTTSSGAVDPSRGIIGGTTTYRRSTVSSGNPPPRPSYISLDAMKGGGVGESPVPHLRTSREGNRVSLASIFTFGHPGRRTSASSVQSVEHSRGYKNSNSNATSHEGSSGRKSTRLLSNGRAGHEKQKEKGYGRIETPSPSHRRSSSDHFHRIHPQLELKHQVLHNQAIQTDEEDYYNSYYSTLLHKPEPEISHQQPQHLQTNIYHPQQASPHSTDSQRSLQPSYSHRDFAYHTNNPDFQAAGVSRQNSASTTSVHPYAYPFPQHDDDDRPDAPQSAPLLPTPHSPLDHGLASGSSTAPRLTFSTPQGQGSISADAAHPAFSHRSIAGGLGGGGVAGSRNLKNSSSTPNFRIDNTSGDPATANAIVNANNPVAPPTFVFPKGKDRWLSAETWCDALLFPRPRLKIKQELLEDGPSGSGSGYGYGYGTSSGRIVSPPGTPLAEAEFGMQQQTGALQQGVASRVLAHSRSLVDLGLGKGKGREKEQEQEREREREKETETEKEKGKERYVYLEDVPQDPQSSSGAGGTARVEAGQQNTARPPRPKSFAQDDLALLTPVPSLQHVIEDGLRLENQRQAWQAQATHSFGNKRARSVSRTRAKSLTQKGHLDGHHHQSSMEYLAAQACLGTQNLSPSIAPPRLAIMGSSHSGGTSDGHTTTTMSSVGRTSHSHSHSNSLVKTLTKSSTNKTHSRTHSRSDSWGKSAVRLAKSTVAICGFPGDSTSELGVGGGESGKEREKEKVLPDLEGALKRDGTRVIRLADPAHIPVDRGLPVPPHHPSQYVRKTPSPAGSSGAISESNVGIALGTPPEEEEEELEMGDILAGTRASVPYIPSHPYAQGGASYNNAAPEQQQRQHHQPHRHVDFAGPHPSLVNTTKVPPIADIIARHRQHPYALASLHSSSARDSYLDANGLIAQYRSEDGTPHPSKMWAQLSPGVVREILPSDLQQYSPYMSQAIQEERLGHSPDRDNDGGSERGHPMTPKTSHDAVGFGEALVNAARFRGSQDSGLGTSEDHAFALQQQSKQQPEWQEEDNDLPEFGPKPKGRRNGVQFDSGKPVGLQEAENQDSESPAVTSESSSPQHSPPLLGSPTDLESFQDLFYRPGNGSFHRTPNEAALPDTPSSPHMPSIPWDISMRNRRTGSGLTSLARALSEEFEQMNQEFQRTSSQDSESGISSQRPTVPIRRPTDASLQFVFEEMMRSESPRESMHDPIHAFQPSELLPEDVESSRASSLIEPVVDDNDEDEDQTAIFRLGMVESVSTPPAIASERRISFNGETSFFQDPQRDRTSHTRILSGLQPPPTEATRSSSMTSSSVSRMSALSDFPAPPKDITRKHLSLLSSYFNEALSESESRSKPLPPPPVLLQEDRVTFGGNQNADDVAKILSSQSQS